MARNSTAIRHVIWWNSFGYFTRYQYIQALGVFEYEIFNLERDGVLETNQFVLIPPTECNLLIPENLSLIYPKLSSDQLLEFQKELENDHHALVQLCQDVGIQQFYEQMLMIVNQQIIQEDVEMLWI